MDRRRFLMRLGQGAAALWIGSALGRAGSVRAQTPPTPPATQILRNPIVLGPGATLADRRLVIAPDFRWTSSMSAIYSQSPGVTIRNVQIVGSEEWQRRWDTYNEPSGGPPGIASGTCGIRLQKAPRLRIEAVRIEGLPGAGIDGFGVDDGVIRDVTVTRCFAGIILRNYAPNPRVLIERVQAHDLWGPGPGKWPGVGGPPSRVRPGGFVGSDGVVCHSLRTAIVRDCTVLGEQYASFKIVNAQDTEISGLRGVSLMLQGTSDLEWKIDKEPSRNTAVRDCTFDKSLGYGEVASEGNCIQVSWHVEKLFIGNCTLVAAGRNGHGIQFAGDVHGRVVGCSFDGFNGTRGTVPAHAIEVTDNSSVNEDFASVNTFHNQKRIALRS